MKRMGATLAVAIGVLTWGCSDDRGVRSGAAREVPHETASPTVGSTAATTITSRPATTAATTDGTTAGEPAGERFTDPDGVYTMVIGANWQEVQVVRGVQSWTIGSSAAGVQPNVNVVVQPGVPVGLREYLDGALTGSETFITGGKVVSQDIVTGTSGQTLGRLEFTGVVSGRPLHFLAVVSVESGTAVLATFTADDESFARLAPSVEPYLLTIRRL